MIGSTYGLMFATSSKGKEGGNVAKGNEMKFTVRRLFFHYDHVSKIASYVFSYASSLQFHLYSTGEQAELSLNPLVFLLQIKPYSSIWTRKDSLPPPTDF